MTLNASDLPGTVRSAREALVARRISAVELTTALLELAADRQPELNAYLHLDADAAVAAARASDARACVLPLDGVPICVKDVIDVQGMPTTAGARSWRRHPEADAEAVARLRAAGAIVLGKGHTNEFAYGIDGLNPHHGPCRNPLDPRRLTGGSSSGPAASTAAGLGLAGLGTDTSGSIRVPASLCGLVGVRPTWGTVPTTGVVPLAPTYDTVGPLTRTVADAVLLMSVLAPGSLAAPSRGETRQPDLTGVRVALVDALIDAAVAPLAARLRALADGLERLGARLVPMALPALEVTGDIHRTIQWAEAAAAHAPWFAEQREHYAPDVRARLEAGQDITAVDYLEAQRRRHELQRRVAAATEQVDVLLAPATPTVAPLADSTTVLLSSGAPTPVREALLSCVVPFSQLGWPAVSVSAGHLDGLPFGAQLVGPPRTESTLLRVAAAVEVLVGAR